MAHVVVYSSAYCPYCHRALELLDSLGVKPEVISVDGQPQVREKMALKAGRTSVPQIWIGEEHVGGSDDLRDWHDSGQLAKKLSE